MEQQSEQEPIKPELGLWDAVSIIVGIVIGSSIFTTPPTIFQNVGGPWSGLGVWLACGVLSVVGALCYAELATTYPRSGGDYVYLTRAFGPWVGFLFGWAQIAVILSGSTGAMAFIFGDYLVGLLDFEGQAKEAVEQSKATYATLAAIVAVVGLTALNFMGVVLGKRVQNLLVLTKVLGLGAIIVVGLTAPKEDAWTVTKPIGDLGYPLAFILVLYAYGGWNHAAFVAADMKERRNIPAALILGTLGITVIYVAVNAAYISALGFEGAREWRPTIAADVVKGSKIMNVLVMISALGAMNGLIFTGSRVYTSLGSEHSIFALLGRWHPTLKTPVYALLIQAAVTLLMIVAVGTATGRGIIDKAVVGVGGSEVPWGQYFGGFNTLFAGTAPVFWTFFLLTGLSVFVLRMKDATIERPFKLQMPWYPLLPIVFCGMCLFGLYSAATYAKYVSLIGIIPLLAGVPLFFLSKRTPSLTESALPTEKSTEPTPES